MRAQLLTLLLLLAMGAASIVALRTRIVLTVPSGRVTVAPVSSGEVAGDSSASQHSLSVLSRQDKLFFYPCADCHEFIEPNTEIRILDPDPGHPAELEHGEGEVWCTSCHIQSPYDSLHTLLGEPVGFNESYRVCGGCHSHKLKDWTYGAHGKRVDNWRGDRLLNETR